MSTQPTTRAARAAQAAATPPRYILEIDGEKSGEYNGPYSRYFPLQLWFRLQKLYLFNVPVALETIFPTPDSKALDYLSEVLTELSRPGFIETYTDAELDGAGWLLAPPGPAFQEFNDMVTAGWRKLAALAGPKYETELIKKEERAERIRRLKSGYNAQRLPGNIERALMWVTEQRAELPRPVGPAPPQPVERFDTPAAAAAVAWGEAHTIRYDGVRFEVSSGGQSFRLRPAHFVTWLAAGIVAAAEAHPDAYSRGVILSDGLSCLAQQRGRLASHPDALSHLNALAADLKSEFEKYRRVTALGLPPTAAPAPTPPAAARRAPAPRSVGWGGQKEAAPAEQNRSVADVILVAPFTFEEAAQLAAQLEITDARGRYCLGPRKLGAVVGFCLALQQAGKLAGTIPELVAVIGPLLGANVATRKTGTGVAKKYFKATEKALTRPKPTH